MLAIDRVLLEVDTMLCKLEISRFKSIRDQTLEFGRANLFIGGNGTGKSNILEAIGLVSACLGRGLGDTDIGRKGLRITPPELMKSSFKNDDLPKTLLLNANFSDEVAYKVTLQSRESDPLLRFFSESANIGNKNIFGRGSRGVRVLGVQHPDIERHRGLWDQIKFNSNGVPEKAVSVLSEFSRYVIFSPQADFLRARQSGRMDVPPVGLHGEGLSRAVVSFLSELGRVELAASKKDEASRLEWKIMDESAKLVGLPGWAQSFGSHIADPQLTSRDVANIGGPITYFKDKFMHAKRNKLSVYDSSEGTLFLLFVAIILSHPESPKIFALDNVDNALNPNLTRKLVEQITRVVASTSKGYSRCGAKQVFLTSHNPTALDAFDLFNKDQRVFVVSRNKKGHTIVDPLVPNPTQTREEWQLAMNGRNLSQVWLDGEIPGALGDL